MIHKDKFSGKKYSFRKWDHEDGEREVAVIQDGDGFLIGFCRPATADEISGKETPPSTVIENGTRMATLSLTREGLEALIQAGSELLIDTAT